MIAVENLSYEYPGLKALDDVSFRIERGSITALVGPNGAGKTTLLRCMAALQQPVAGRISIDGIDVLAEPRACHRVIGYLSDFYGLYQRLTVAQSLHFVARAQGIDERDCPAAVAETSRRLGISDRLQHYPGELSRGLRQRVAIAQAIIHRPKLVLLDEPASGLDPEARQQLAELFLSLQAEGMTLLVSSHILAELEAYCSHMLVLRQGRIVEKVTVRTENRGKPFKLVLARPVDNLAALLQDLPAVAVLEIENRQSALLDLPADAECQHRTLKSLLDLNLPVCEFAPAASHLQDRYLKTLRPDGYESKS